MTKRLPIDKRLWRRVDVRRPDECWPWTGKTNRTGHGVIRRGGRGSPEVFAHRVAYEVQNGPIPPGLDIRHTCDNPPCCNGRHLITGTRADNNRDTQERGRLVRGERQWNSKLTEAQVIAIRSDTRPQKVIAAEYGVRPPTIHKIKTGKAWKHA